MSAGGPRSILVISDGARDGGRVEIDWKEESLVFSYAPLSERQSEAVGSTVDR